jgi:sec-independent protein translocase protein TatA
MDLACAPLAFIDGLGGPEMVLIFVIILVLFGGQKLPEFARGLGKSIREFKKAAAGVEEEFKRALEEDDYKKKVAPAPVAAALPPADPAPAILPPDSPSAGELPPGQPPPGEPPANPPPPAAGTPPGHP